MGREARKVPPGWEHPRDANGNHIPLFYGAGGEFEEQLEDYARRKAAWDSGENKSRADNPDMPFEEWAGKAPDPDDYMLIGVPDSACTMFQLYESTSEGTPMGPPFATLEEVAEHAAEHATTFARFKATKYEWLRMLQPDGMVMHREGNFIFI